MNSYSLTLGILLVASILQIWGSALAIEAVLRAKQHRRLRRTWLAVAGATMLIALHDGYALELAMRTGLYDLRQAVLIGLAALLMAFAIHGFRRWEA
ncbi:hypothetical protein LZ012_01870 [Dechloromonas sp. XY25]|uniref:Uncharacterized protein n=1 Tax=Dechloromonas hankyongensis TaxID=2908002 RepID=A0ABS9JXW0_9RHOO|nr:hypothetical protein [Dechloromonas hankyongensis]MCG2575737.1 hypothetical protein [Dechloromonas hankyongensis]